jgi:hypothetical protein
LGATVGLPLPRAEEAADPGRDIPGVIRAVGAGVDDAEGVGVAAGVSAAPAVACRSTLSAGVPPLAGGADRFGGIFTCKGQVNERNALELDAKNVEHMIHGQSSMAGYLSHEIVQGFERGCEPKY